MRWICGSAFSAVRRAANVAASSGGHRHRAGRRQPRSRRRGGNDMASRGAHPRSRLIALGPTLLLALSTWTTFAAPVVLATTTGIDVSLPLGHRIGGTITVVAGHPLDGAE